MGEDDPGGGSLSLAELIDEHGAALLSDFKACHGIWLPDVLDDPTYPPRLLLALVEDISDRNEAYSAAVLGGREHRGWGIKEHLLANLFDLTAKTAQVKWQGDPPTTKRPQTKQQKTEVSPFLAWARAAIREGGQQE